jgi:hypothetical protein
MSGISVGLLVVAACGWLGSATAYAQSEQTRETPLRIPTAFTLDAGGLRVEKPGTRPASLMPPRDLFTVAASGVQPPRASFEKPRRSVGMKVLGGVLGGFGGFFAGGYIGAKLEPDCNCDDPGFRGFLIGAPIGAVGGAIAGAMLISR